MKYKIKTYGNNPICDFSGQFRNPNQYFIPFHAFVLSLSVMSNSVQPFGLYIYSPPYIDHQAPLSMGFFRQEYWNRLSFPPPGDLLDPVIKPVSPVSPTLQVDSLPSEPLGKPFIPIICHY